MRQYLRLMRRHSVTAQSQDELDALLTLLKDARGVSDIDFQGLHPKGGYRVTLNVAEESLNDFFDLLERGDWMSVL
ncbi:hypothetical protein [Massilia rubra]|uniref:Uncharacterized protein n=1 Tax=Massilia rubra TaxID=2607910 RepID=A0ABX0LGY2_9BURK|nr:hypothetical protein [Massilia rubra]NHZ33305.1 hypothetical protein [Massilia rubra]